MQNREPAFGGRQGFATSHEYAVRGHILVCMQFLEYAKSGGSAVLMFWLRLVEKSSLASKATKVRVEGSILGRVRGRINTHNWTRQAMARGMIEAGSSTYK